MAYPTSPKRGILIVDPQPNMSSLVATMLLSLGKRDIRETSEAQQALTEIARRQFDIIIIDDAITGPDAVELVRRLRTSPDGLNRETPVIMMAAAPDATRITAARDAGVTEFLRKPFAANHLAMRLESIAAKPRGFIEATNYAGPDRRRRSVAVGDKDRRQARTTERQD
jgi:two-component system chemotaxis response regulator CheY